MILYRFSNFLKGNYLLQFLVVTFSFLSCSLFCLLLLSDIGGFVETIEKNSTTFEQDEEVTKLSSFTVLSNGKVEYETVTGVKNNDAHVTFLFVYDTDGSSYITEDGTFLICEVSKDFWLNTLTGSGYWLVLIFSFISFLSIFSMRARDYIILSKNGVLAIFIFNFMFTLSTGVMVFICLS